MKELIRRIYHSWIVKRLRSVAIIYCVSYYFSRVIDMADKQHTAAQIIQDKLTTSAGTAGTSVTSAATALNLDTIIDQISIYGGLLVMVTVLVVNYYTIQSFRQKKKRESEIHIQTQKKLQEEAEYFKQMSDNERAQKELALHDLAITNKVLEVMGKSSEAHKEAVTGIQSQVVQMREVRKEA